MSTIRFQHGLLINCVIIALFASLGNTVIHAANMDKGPYLIYNGTNTEMEVLWQLDATQSCTLEWGTSTSYSDGSVPTTEYGTDHQHRYTITGLNPGVKYYYRITEGGNTYTGSFNAAPPDSATNLKMFVFGDTRSQPAKMDEVTEQMIATYQTDPAFQTISLHSGDWVNSNSESDWTGQFFNRAYANNLEFQANVPIQGSWGNHEGGADVWNKYYPYPFVNGFYWSFDYGPVHVVVIDQHILYTTGSIQHNWLVDDLQNTSKLWKIAVFHYPGWGSGYHSNNTTVQNHLHPVFVEYNVPVIIQGHNHNYVRCDVNGLQYITAGGGGAPLYNVSASDPYVVACEKTYHHCEIDIQGNKLYFNAIKSDGSVIDTFTITIDTDPPKPDPAEFDSSPASASATSISMTATTATDDSPVEYYFKNITISGHDSGWQEPSTYTDTALTTGQVYGYKVRCRDLSANYNMTDFSAPEFSMAGSIGATVTVPDIAGYDPNIAEKVIVASGLTVGAFDSAHSEIFAIGRISSQNPPGETTADPNDPVDFTVSLGLLADHDDDDMVGLSDIVIVVSDFLNTTDLTDFAEVSSQWFEIVAASFAYWPFDSDALDDSLNGWHGTLNGDASFTTDPNRGYCLLLDGDGDYMNVGFILNPADGPFSLCAWVKNGTDKDNIMCQTNGTGTARIWLHTNASGYLATQVRTSGGGGLFSAYSGHTDGNWHHVAMVYDGNRRYLYADGDLVASDSSDLSESLEACDGDLYVGASQALSADAFWDGLMDDVRIYNKAMSSSEIFALYNSEVLP